MKKLITFLFIFIGLFLTLVFTRAPFTVFKVKIEIPKKNFNIKDKKVRIFHNQNDFNDYVVIDREYEFFVYKNQVQKVCLLEQETCRLFFKRVEKIKEASLMMKVVINFFSTLIILFLSSCGFLLYKWIRYNKEMSIVSLISIISLSLWNVISAPALFDFDFIESLYNIHNYAITGWFSYLYELFLSSFLNIGFSIRYLSVLSSFLFLVIYLWFYKAFLLNTVSYQFKLISLLSLFIPMVGVMNNFLTRDTYFGLLSGLLAFLMVRSFQSYNILQGHYRKILTGVILYIVFTIRPESLVLVIVFFTFLYLSKLNKKDIHSLLFIFVCLNTVLFPLKTFLVRDRNLKTEKLMTTLMSYHYIMRDKTKDSFKVKHFNLDQTHGYLERAVSESEYKKLKNQTTELILKNPVHFLRNKLSQFCQYIGFNFDQLYLFGNDFYIYYKKQFKILYAHDFDLRKLKPSSFISLESSQKVLSFISTKMRFTFWLIFPLLILVTYIYFFKTLKAYAIGGLFLLSRLPLVILLAPAVQVKYLYDIYLFAYLTLPIALWELRNSKRYKASSKVSRISSL